MSTAATSEPQQFVFQTEIRQLLHLLSHSLYQHKEIAIRELVSNASDALGKLRHARLAGLVPSDDAPLEITLEPFKDERVLELRDNGIGMSREELIENLGTIAHSGSLAYLGQLADKDKADLSLIGQFGVGFYSAFMLADRVEVLTRGATSDQAWRWESDGTGNFSIQPLERAERGTTIRLHLKQDNESSFDDFLLPWKLQSIVRQYSTFVPFPIKVDGEQVNTQRPIWVEPKSQVTDEQYAQFFQFLSHRSDDPLWHLHFSSDTPLQLHAVLYCPPDNFEKLGFGRIEHGMHLCAKRILVQDNNRDLLPDYLRFIYGLVDSADLPLNVSRETLQDSTMVPKIRRVLTRKVLDHLASIAESDAAKFDTFYAEFGPILRTGVASDYDNQERIAKLLRFPSTTTTTGTSTGTTSFDAYQSRMPEAQKQIYFLGGPDAATLARNPHLDIYRERNIEVLLLTDPVDEWVLSQLRQFGELPIVSIDSSEAEPPVVDSADKPEQPAAATEAELDGLLGLFRDALGDKVAEVKSSSRLTTSPCCLVSPKGAMTPQLQLLLKSTQKDFELSKRTFEINPKSAFIGRLAKLAESPDQREFVTDCARQLHASTLLLEGLAPEANETAERMQKFMEELAAQRAG